MIDEKYEILNIIQKGAFGSIFECKKIKTGKIYACKKFSKKFKKTAEREAVIMLKLQHENIIKIKDALKDENSYYIIMQLCDGDLFDYIDNTFLSSKKLFSYTIQIANALDYMHNNKYMIHKDIKPENILMYGDTLKLCDFGFACDYDITTKKIYEENGTLSYMCPELMMRLEVYGPEIDIWAFGVVIYILYMHEFPFNIQNKSDFKKLKNVETCFITDKPIRNALMYCFSPLRENIKDILKILVPKPKCNLYRSISI